MAAPGNVLERAYRGRTDAARIADGGDLRVAHRDSLGGGCRARLAATARYASTDLPPQSSALAQAQRLEAEPPDWLRDASGASVDSGPSLTPPASSEIYSDRPEAELPDWLKGLQESDQALPSSAASIPAWPDESSPVAAEAPRAGVVDLPASESAGGEPGLSGSESFESAPEASEAPVPEWLRGTRRAGPGIQCRTAAGARSRLVAGPGPGCGGRAGEEPGSASAGRAGRRDGDRAGRPVARLATLVPN